jgi:hypothetical protein
MSLPMVEKDLRSEDRSRALLVDKEGSAATLSEDSLLCLFILVAVTYLSPGFGTAHDTLVVSLSGVELCTSFSRPLDRSLVMRLSLCRRSFLSVEKRGC